MKRLSVLILSAAMIVSLVACNNYSSDGNNGGNNSVASTTDNTVSETDSKAAGNQESTGQTDTANENSTFLTIENVDPITTTDEMCKPFVDYINEYVYTSDFDKPKKNNAHEFYLTTPDSKRQQISLLGEIKLDDSVTVKLRDSLLYLCETPYIMDTSFNAEKTIKVIYKNAGEFERKQESVDLVKGEGNKIGIVYYKNLEQEDTEAKNCTIVEMTVVKPTHSEPEIEYMGINVGDSLEKVISGLSSKVCKLFFEY